MTLPDERYRSLVQTRRFLLDLCNSEHTPRVPKIIRDTARSMLRHYPSDYELDRLAAAAPDILQQRMDDLHRMILSHEQTKREKTIDNPEEH